jgi:hypothetical protein
MNKTGTTSIHKAFEMIGIRSIHWAPANDNLVNRMKAAMRMNTEIQKQIKQHNDNPLGAWDKYQAYSDKPGNR